MKYRWTHFLTFDVKTDGVTVTEIKEWCSTIGALLQKGVEPFSS